MHEIAHTAGVWHEQSRHDRNAYIQINWEKIEQDPDRTGQFEPYPDGDGEDWGRYDYGSIMHYPPTAFSIDGSPTIEATRPLPPGVVMVV